MSKRLAIDIIMILFLAGLLIAIVYLVVIFKSEGAECIHDPLVYGVRESGKSIDADMFCTCNIADERFTPFVVNASGKKPIIEERVEAFYNLSFNNELIKQSLKIE